MTPLESRLRIQRTSEGTVTAWVESDIDGQWLSGWGEPGEWSAARLGSRAPVPRGGITKRLLGRVPMRELAGHLRGLLRASATAGDARAERIQRIFPEAQGLELIERPRSERGTGRPDWFFARLAVEYADAVATGSRRPVAELAARRHFTPEKIRDMLHEARERGLLSKGRRGVAGGEPTPRAKELLKQRAKTRGRTR